MSVFLQATDTLKLYVSLFCDFFFVCLLSSIFMVQVYDLVSSDQKLFG